MGEGDRVAIVSADKGPTSKPRKEDGFGSSKDDLNERADTLGASSQNREFLLKEFEALRSEIDLQITERRKIEGQLLVGLPIFYSWTVTQSATLEPTVYNALLLVPVLAAVLGIIRWSGLMLTVIHLGKYIFRVERSLLGAKYGWETYMVGRRKNSPFLGQLEGWSGVLFWVVVSAFTTVAAYYLWRPV